LISLERARLIAERFLDSNVRETIEFEVVVIEDAVRDEGTVWVFSYNGKGFVEQGDVSQLLAGNQPVAVEKKTGTASFSMGTVR
jgi:hypothetical protein